MAEPKKRLTSTRSGARQSHDFLKPKNTIKCSHCKENIVPHRICPNCGYYRGKKIVEMKSEIEKQKKVSEELKEGPEANE